jgi:hypothetical protein
MPRPVLARFKFGAVVALKISALGLIRWVLSNDERTARAIRLTVVVGVTALLVCCGIGLAIASTNVGVSVGTLSAAGAWIGIRWTKRKHDAGR